MLSRGDNFGIVVAQRRNTTLFGREAMASTSESSAKPDGMIVVNGNTLDSLRDAIRRWLEIGGGKWAGLSRESWITVNTIAHKDRYWNYSVPSGPPSQMCVIAFERKSVLLRSPPCAIRGNALDSVQGFLEHNPGAHQRKREFLPSANHAAPADCGDTCLFQKSFLNFFPLEPVSSTLTHA